jgi:hypothetical protein
MSQGVPYKKIKWPNIIIQLSNILFFQKSHAMFICTTRPTHYFWKKKEEDNNNNLSFTIYAQQRALNRAIFTKGVMNINNYMYKKSLRDTAGEKRSKF